MESPSQTLEKSAPVFCLTLSHYMSDFFVQAFISEFTINESKDHVQYSDFDHFHVR